MRKTYKAEEVIPVPGNVKYIAHAEMRGVPFGKRQQYNRKNQDHLATYSNDWRDEAACQGQPHKWFELPDNMGNGSDERTQEIAELLSKGQAVCLTCPVRRDCDIDATNDDRRFTVRGGKRPTVFTGRKIGRPRGSSGTSTGSYKTMRSEFPKRNNLTPEQTAAIDRYIEKNKTCNAGHPTVYRFQLSARSQLSRGKRGLKVICRKCKMENDQEYKARVRAKMGV